MEKRREEYEKDRARWQFRNAFAAPLAHCYDPQHLLADADVSDAPIEMRRFGLNPFPPATGPRVHAALRSLVTGGKIRPVIGRRVSMGEVAEALEDHDQKRTVGRTVVDVTR